MAGTGVGFCARGLRPGRRGADGGWGWLFFSPVQAELLQSWLFGGDQGSDKESRLNPVEHGEACSRFASAYKSSGFH